MSGANQSFRFYVVALLILFMLSVFASYRVQIEVVENLEGLEGNRSSDDGFSEPWESPMQELQRIAERCDKEVPGFIQIADEATATWKACMDSINPNLSPSESTIEIIEMEENDDGTTADPFPIISEMPICFNTTAFKSCWLSVIAALNECEKGIGDVVGAIYFALYDDTCRKGGRLTIENRRIAAEGGDSCFRNYSTPECEKNKMLRDSNDVCLRFNSITACDLSSIDPDCSNEEDKVLHVNIFERVRHQLQCDSLSNKSNSGVELKTGYNNFYIASIIIIFIAIKSHSR